MKHYILLFYLIGIFCSNIAFANQPAMYGWRTHLAYNQTKMIVQSAEKVYAISTEGALFSVGKDDDLVEIYSKIYGLNDNIVTNIAYSTDNNTLVIIYDNSNIDLLTDDGEIYNIPDIYNKNISHSKKINNICVEGDVAYLACDFGVVAIDIKKREVKDTYIIGDNASYVEIYNISVLEGKIFATEKAKIYYADIDKDNLLNYQNWKQLSSLPTSDIKDFAATNSVLYVLGDDNVLHSYENNTWTKQKTNITNINTDGDILWYTTTSGEVCNTQNSYTFKVAAPQNAMNDTEDENVIWFSEIRGIGKHYIDVSAAAYYKPSGPITKNSWRIKYSDGRIFVVPGGRWAIEYNRVGYVMFYENEKWKSYINSDLKAFTNYKVTDIVDVAIDPNDKTHFFVASYGMGLFEFKNDVLVKHYTAHNSAVETFFPDKPTDSDAYNYYQRVDGLRFDKNGNLWFLNVGKAPIKYLTPNGQFVTLSHPDISQFQTLQDILIYSSKPDLKLMLAPRSLNTNSTALFVFNDRGTASVNDDQTKIYSSFTDQDGKAFRPSNFHCIKEDKDGALWIGTTTGVAIISNIGKIFDNNMTVNRIKIPRNDGTGLADYLLATEQINDIAIDGANRKWFATEKSGVYLTSADGLETIHHFTQENSPLLSNTVKCININEKTGEVFMGTSNGVISFQSDAKEAGKDFENVHAYPNPVRPEHTGPVTITGLIENTVVKITDVNGFVVYETMSNGGVATWDGCLKDGRRAATGVYVVMCVQKDSKKNATTKILFIN